MSHESGYKLANKAAWAGSRTVGFLGSNQTSSIERRSLLLLELSVQCRLN